MRSTLVIAVVLLAMLILAAAIQHTDYKPPKPASSNSKAKKAESSTNALDCSRKPPAGTDGRCVFSGGRCYPTGCPCAGGKIRSGKKSGCGKKHDCCIPDGMGYMMNFKSGHKNNSVGQDQADNVRLIKEECAKQNVTGNQLAYVLATATFESGLRPVEEYGVCVGSHKKSYCPYNGRGFVQLTHQGNYKKVGDLVGKDLVANPDLAMDTNIAKYAICYGMRTGLFTGKKLSDYINAHKKDYKNARKIINGMSGADKFADAAAWWEKEISGTNTLTVVPGPYVVEESESSSSSTKSKSKSKL